MVNAKYSEGKGKLLYGFLIILIAGYVFFFTSKLWLPAAYEGVEVTPFGTAVEANDRTITIDSWTYSKDERKMEILVEIENMSLDGIDSYKWQVKSPSGNLDTNVIFDTPELVVLQVSKAPKNITELALLMSLKSEDAEGLDFETVKIYTNDKYVKSVSSISKKTLKEYRAQAVSARIDALESELKTIEKEKKEIKEQIAVAEDKIKELTEEMEYQTDSEKEKSSEQILTVTNEKENLEDELAAMEEDIAELEDAISLQKERKAEYE